METSLVVQTSFIGDVILTTPLIAALAARGTVDVVTTPAGASVLANNPDVRNLFVYDKRGQDRGLGGFARMAGRIRQTTRVNGVSAERIRYETAAAPGTMNSATSSSSRTPARRAYLCQGSVRSGVLAFVSGYTNRIGFATSGGAWTYTTRVEYRDDWHHTRRLLSLLDYTAASSANDAAIQPRLYPGEADITAINTLLGARTRPLVAIAPGSVWATKRWPYYADLCRALLNEFDVAVIGGTGDAEPLGDLLADSRVIDATGKLSLLGSAALIARAKVIITNDSSPQHLASAVGTPTVTVFGPTVPEFGFGPLAPGSRVVGRTDLACRPCDRHGPQRCPLGHWRCMRDVGAEEVLATVITVIHQDATR